jgi:hypothetical protein
LFVARNDGIVELYSLESSDEFELRASKKINEAITGMDVGSFKNVNQCELIISTFSGRLILLRENENSMRKVSGVNGKKDDKKILKDQEAKIK